MRKDIADLWAAKLRSGELGQLKRQLATADFKSMCCLGVLCQLHMEQTKEGRWGDALVVGRPQYIDKANNPHTTVPPEGVVEWAGLADGNPTAASNGHTLAYLNDNGHTFDQIADLIEQNWETL